VYQNGPENSSSGRHPSFCEQGSSLIATFLNGDVGQGEKELCASLYGVSRAPPSQAPPETADSDMLISKNILKARSALLVIRLQGRHNSRPI
jgi:hypothetical protein